LCQLVTHGSIPLGSYAFVSEAKPFKGWGTGRHTIEPVPQFEAITDALCSLTKADLEPFLKYLKQDRRSDIGKFKQGIGLLRRVDERLGGAKGSSAKRSSNVVPFTPKAKRPPGHDGPFCRLSVALLDVQPDRDLMRSGGASLDNFVRTHQNRSP
jgi:hypothetical protein